MYGSDEQDPIDFAIDAAIAVGNCTLVIDEVDQFSCSQYLSPALYWALHYGRHYNLNIIVASRQPNRIRPDITGQADTIISFQCQGPVIDYLQQFTDIELYGILPKLVDSGGNPSHEFFCILGDFSLDNLSYLA